jgi:hypothetical protein
MAGCFGIGRTPRRVAEVYHITPKLVGFSDFPLVVDVTYGIPKGGFSA